MKSFQQTKSPTSRYRLKFKLLVAAFSIFYASLCLSQNTTMFSWFPDWQDESAIEQEAALVNSRYDDESFDQKRKPGRGGFGGSFIEVLELFRPILTVQERVFQKIFSTLKSFAESEKSMWHPAVRTLIIGWREQTHYHTESPEFTQVEEVAANTESELVIYEVPVSKGGSSGDKEKKTYGEDASSNGKDTGASDVRHKPESIKEKQENEDEQPPEESSEHTCDGSNCPACNFEPCHCKNCLVKSKSQSINPSLEQFESRGLAEEPSINSQGRSRHILDIDNMDVLTVLPDGTLIVRAKEHDELTSRSILTQQRIKHWRTIEVSLPLGGDVVVIDSSQFIVISNGLYTYYSNQDGCWTRVELGEHSDVALLNNDRFITAPPFDGLSYYQKLVGDYHIWSVHENQPVSTPLVHGDNARKPSVLVLEKSNRIVTFHDSGVVKIWTEENKVWTVSILSGDRESYQNVGVLTELEDGRLLSRGETLGIWSLVAGNWVYSKLLSEKFSWMYTGLILLDNNRFVTYQNYQGESRSLKFWVIQGDTWSFEELNHQHNERIINIQSINGRQFITWSHDSAKIWTCQESCSFIELTGKNNISFFEVLAANKLISWNYWGEIQLWCEHNSLWSNEPFNRLSRYSMGIDRVTVLPNGYLTATYSGVYGFIIPSRSYHTTIWSLSSDENNRENQSGGEHLQRVEQDTLVEYEPWKKPFESD